MKGWEVRRSKGLTLTQQVTRMVIQSPYELSSAAFQIRKNNVRFAGRPRKLISIQHTKFNLKRFVWLPDKLKESCIPLAHDLVGLIIGDGIF